ncbi:MAG: flagellar hook-length control protein FliK [Burkholderiales bacterium]|nr:flagellar hook-length control protein FliK [Burkholderiales bacterium]
MTNLPIAASAPTPTTVKRAQANALQQNAGLPGAAPAEENSFRDALVQMMGKGLGNAFSAAGDAAVASSKADSSRGTVAQTDPALDAAAQPDALALPQWFASALAPVATGPVGLSTVLASAKTALDPQTAADTPAALDASAVTDALALTNGLALPMPPALALALAPAAGPAPDASTLPLPQGLASALIPAATRPVGLSTVLANSKTALDPQTAADTAPVLDANALPASTLPANALPASALPASALPAGPALPHLGPKTAAANALSALAPEAPKEVLAAPVFETASSRTEAPVAFSIAAQATETGSSAPTRGVPEPSASVQTRVGERAWDQAVGEKLVWMVNQKHQVAQLHLNPPELGPLKISISLDQNQASAQFFSAHASVREALETAMPRLREMLADSGITLGNASVGTEAFREPTQQQPRAHVAQAGVVAVDSGMVSSGERLLRPMLGLVDTFA